MLKAIRFLGWWGIHCGINITWATTTTFSCRLTAFFSGVTVGWAWSPKRTIWIFGVILQKDDGYWHRRTHLCCEEPGKMSPVVINLVVVMLWVLFWHCWLSDRKGTWPGSSCSNYPQKVCFRRPSWNWISSGKEGKHVMVYTVWMLPFLYSEIKCSTILALIMQA